MDFVLKNKVNGFSPSFKIFVLEVYKKNLFNATGYCRIEPFELIIVFLQPYVEIAFFLSG